MPSGSVRAQRKKQKPLKVVKTESDRIRGIGSRESSGWVGGWALEFRRAAGVHRWQSIFCRNELPGSSHLLYRQEGGKSGDHHRTVDPDNTWGL